MDMVIIFIIMMTNIVKVITYNVLIEMIFKVARIDKQQKNHFYIFAKKNGHITWPCISRLYR